MTSIIEELASWARQNSAMLAGRGVQLTERFPDPKSASPWKASIGLVYKGAIVSYTVWERSGFQTELIVMNAGTGKTVVMDEGAPTDPTAVNAELDGVCKKLLNEIYSSMDPDPKLTIT